jgi:general secretion pathway protein D
LIGIREAQIPWYMLLRYPKDWPQIRESRRKYAVGAAAESPANRAVRKKLMQTHRKFEFSGVPFEQVTEFMREVSGASIHVKWNALEQAGINRDTPVNVKLTDVTIEKALRTILEDVGGINDLGFVIDDGVITISTKEDLSRQVVTRVYDISDLIIRVPNFIAPRIDLSNQAGNAGGNNVGNGGGGFFGGGTGTNNVTGNNVGEENEVTRQQLIDDILELIRTTISPDSWITAAGTGSIREMGGQIVVSQTPENQESLVRLLEQLREAKALQINVEARFIQVTTGFLNHIGIDLDFYFNLSSRLKPVDDGTGAFLTDPLTGARIVDRSAAAYLPQWERRGLISNRWTPLGARLGSFEFAGPQQTLVPGSIGGTATSSALSIAGTFLDDMQVDFLISATQANQSTRTLTAPRLTLYNGQRAYVTVATQQAYVAGTEPEVVENVAAFRPIIGTVSTGTTLDVEATISADRKYVNMTIRPQVSTVNGFIEYQGAVDADGNPIPGSGSLQLPNVTIQEVQCTVSVPDKGTLLLGGQRLAGEVEREMGVPILAKIPVLNRAFTNRSIVRDEQTLLIMVKPEIIIQKEYEDTTFPE